MRDPGDISGVLGEFLLRRVHMSEVRERIAHRALYTIYIYACGHEVRSVASPSSPNSFIDVMRPVIKQLVVIISHGVCVRSMLTMRVDG